MKTKDSSLLIWEDSIVYYLQYSKDRYGLEINPELLSCANIPISIYFKTYTGMTINKHLKIADFLSYSLVGEVNKLKAYFFVIASANTIYICWRTRSGKPFDMNHIDCEDLEFWLEGLDPARYLEELNPYGPPALPFRLKNLSYTLKINSLQTDQDIDIVLKAGELPRAVQLMEQLYAFINSYNEASEKKRRRPGLVHNARGQLTTRGISLSLDMGSAGEDFFKKFLTYLSELNVFDEVVLE